MTVSLKWYMASSHNFLHHLQFLYCEGYLCRLGSVEVQKSAKDIFLFSLQVYFETNENDFDY